MDFKRALDKEQTTCINGIFVVFVFLSHFGQYEVMPWNGILLAIGQLMVAPFLFFSGYGIMEQIQKRGVSYIDSMPRKRILKFYVHFCMALTIYLVLSFVLGKGYSLSRILLSFTGWSSIGNSNWYVFAILVMYSIVYISFKCFKKQNLSICVLLTLLYIVVMKEAKGVGLVVQYHSLLSSRHGFIQVQKPSLFCYSKAGVFCVNAGFSFDFIFGVASCSCV